MKKSNLLGTVGAGIGSTTYWTVGRIAIVGINGIGAAISIPALVVATISTIFFGVISFVVGLSFDK